MKKYLLLFLIAYTGLTTSTIAQDKTYVHFDKGFYVAGESIWFTAYLPTILSELSLLHVDLQAEDGAVILHQQIRVSDNGLSTGRLALPFDIAEAQYLFRLWGLQADGQEAALLYSLPLAVYNDLVSPETKTPVGAAPNISNTPNFPSQNQISIQTNAEEYGQREAVDLMIEVKDERGQPIAADLSIAVVADGLQMKASAWEAATNLNTVIQDWQKNPTVYGQTKSVEEEQAVQLNVLSAFLTKSQQNTWCKTDAKGQLVVALPDFEGRQNLQLFTPRLSTAQPDFTGALEEWPLDVVKARPFPKGGLNRDALVEQYLDESRKRKKIAAFFGTDTLGLIVSVDTLDQVLAPDRSYFPDRYVAFKSFEEFIFEVVLPLRIKRKKNKIRARLLNEDTKLFFDNAPLLMIDNQLSYDVDRFLALELSAIKRLDLYINNQNLKKQFSALGRNGVVAVFTKGGDAALAEEEQRNTFLVEGFEAPSAFYSPNYDDPDSAQRRQPDFRPVLFWEGQVQTDEQGRAALRFYHSDDYGKFRIQVFSRDAKGQLGLQEKLIQVLPKQGG
ncbi:MAG: hypothetical protein AAFP19_14255 [Bacteroidota bacterium]